MPLENNQEIQRENAAAAPSGLQSEWMQYTENKFSLAGTTDKNEPSNTESEKAKIQTYDKSLKEFGAEEFVTPHIEKLQGMVRTFNDAFNKDDAGKAFDKNFAVLTREMNRSLKGFETQLEKEQLVDDKLTKKAIQEIDKFDKLVSKLPADKQNAVRELVRPVDGEDIDERETRVLKVLSAQHPHLVKPYYESEEADFAKEAHRVGTMRDLSLSVQSTNLDIERAKEIKELVNNRANLFAADLENESVKIADLMDKNQGDAAMKALSKDLSQLNDVHFNQLLLNLYQNDTKGDGLDLDLGHFNPKTGTFEYAKVDHSSLHSEHPNPYRIVQKNDTVSGIASDWLNTKRSAADVAKYTKEIADANGLKNPNSIKPGQALKLPATSKHHYPEGE